MSAATRRYIVTVSVAAAAAAAAAYCLLSFVHSLVFIKACERQRRTKMNEIARRFFDDHDEDRPRAEERERERE
jgi:hypothetical protein